MTEPLPADLVLEGGGVKGIALAGALAELLPRYRFNRVAGTSAGAIAAAFVAAGAGAEEIRAALDRLDHARVPDSWLPVPGLSAPGGCFSARERIPAGTSTSGCAGSWLPSASPASATCAGRTRVTTRTSLTGSATSWS